MFACFLSLTQNALAPSPPLRADLPRTPRPRPRPPSRQRVPQAAPPPTRRASYSYLRPRRLETEANPRNPCATRAFLLLFTATSLFPSPFPSSARSLPATERRSDGGSTSSKHAPAGARGKTVRVRVVVVAESRHDLLERWPFVRVRRQAALGGVSQVDERP